jgi:hypothetical protein
MTKTELEKRLKTLPDTIRVQIVHHIAEALCEINAAECLLIREGWFDSDLPVLPGSLNTALASLQRLIDFEN